MEKLSKTKRIINYALIIFYLVPLVILFIYLLNNPNQATQPSSIIPIIIILVVIATILIDIKNTKYYGLKVNNALSFLKTSVLILGLVFGFGLRVALSRFSNIKTIQDTIWLVAIAILFCLAVGILVVDMMCNIKIDRETRLKDQPTK